MPKVSIITPVYNRPEYLEEAVKSIQDQAFDDWEHIIIDDGSTNPETQIVLKKIKTYPHISIFRTENKGLGAARNYGIDKASGIYILTLDDDDKWHKDFVLRAVEILDKLPGIGVVSSWLKYFGKGKAIIKPQGGGILNFLIHNNCVHAMFRKQCWLDAGKYDENKFFQPYTDWDLWLRITANGFSVKIIEDTMFYYRTHKDSSMLKDSERNHLELFSYMVKKNKHIYSDYLADTLVLFEEKLLKTRKDYNQKNPFFKLKGLLKSILPK